MSSQSPYPNTVSAPATRRRRAQIACRNCRKRKIRCVTNEEPPHDPCERCQRMNLVCEYVAVGDPSPPSTPTPERSGYMNAGPSYAPGQLSMYNSSPHTHHSSATHAPYSHSSRPTDGMHRSQGHSSNSMYPNQNPLPSNFLPNTPWPDHDIQPGDFRGVPATPGYPSRDQQYYRQQGGTVDPSLQGSWPGSIQQQPQRGYGYNMQGPATNFSNTGQVYDNGAGYGMNPTAYPCPVCMQRHCICNGRRAT